MMPSSVAPTRLSHFFASESFVVAGENELRGHVNRVTESLDGARHDRVRVQIASDLSRRFPGVPIRHHRTPIDDPKRSRLRKIGDQLIGDSLRHISAGRVRSEVFERKHGDGENSVLGSRNTGRDNHDDSGSRDEQRRSEIPGRAASGTCR